MHHCPSNLLHLVELRVDGLASFLEHVDELLGLLGIGGGEESVGCASVFSTSCAANSMDVVLSVGGKVKIDHILNVSHVFSVQCEGQWGEGEGKGMER